MLKHSFKAWLRRQVWLWDMPFRSYLQWNKSRIWQALACQWPNALCKTHKQAMWLLTCRKSPICSISSLKCSIFLLMVKLGSFEVYSWRLPLVKARRTNYKLSSRQHIVRYKENPINNYHWQSYVNFRWALRQKGTFHSCCPGKSANVFLYD